MENQPQQSNNNSKWIIISIISILIIGGGYFAYTKFMNKDNDLEQRQKSISGSILTKEEAQAIAMREIIKSDPKIEYLVLENQTKEYDFGWVFYYTAQNPDDRGPGNAPIIVNKFDGSFEYTGTAESTEIYIKNYQEKFLKNIEINPPVYLLGDN